MRAFIDIVESYMRQTYFGGFRAPLPRSTVIKYMTGWCPYFALALHDLYGMELVSTGTHYACRTADGRFVDARGIMSAEAFARDVRGEIRPVTRDDVIRDLETGIYECGFYNERDLAAAKRQVKKAGPEISS